MRNPGSSVEFRKKLKKRLESHARSKQEQSNEDKKSISPTFARAAYFKIGDRIYENPFRESVPAGPQAAEYVASLGAKTVVAGGFGPNASKRLRELGVTPKIYGG